MPNKSSSAVKDAPPPASGATAAVRSESRPASASAPRRREPGSASARSLLLTVLGEFVHPRGEPVWTATLVSALGLLGVEEKSARQALARSAAEGLMVSTRQGRRVQWDLTPQGRELLQEGTERIYGFMRDGHGWDGRWLVLSVAIPETQRRLRHRLRTRLTWLGLGSPTPGLWVTPDAVKEPAIAEIVADLGLRTQAYAWVGTTSTVGDHTRMINDAWRLDDVETLYNEFIDVFETRAAKTPDDAFVAQVQLVQEWRRFPALDPDLPG